MRKFSEQESRELLYIICNCCGRKITAKNGIVEEECVRLEVPFGFFSKRTGRYTILIYVRTVMTKSFQNFRYRWK